MTKVHFVLFLMLIALHLEFHLDDIVNVAYLKYVAVAVAAVERVVSEVHVLLENVNELNEEVVVVVDHDKLNAVMEEQMVDQYSLV